MGYTPTGGPAGLGVIDATPATVDNFNQLIALIASRGPFLGAVTTSQRDAITGSALFPGAQVFNTDTGGLETYSGSGWAGVVPVQARITGIDGGTVAIAALANGAGTTPTVNFHSGRFTTPPLLFPVILGTTRLTTNPVSVTTSSASVQVSNLSNGSSPACTLQWLAIQI